MTARLRRGRRSRLPRLPVVGWGLFLLLFPIYVFDSGNPQPADMILAAVMVLTFATRSISIPAAANSVLRPFAWFAAYALAVNMAWVLVLNDARPLIYGVFYVYNVGIFFLFWVLFQQDRFAVLKTTLYALSAAVVMQALFVWFVPWGSRVEGTFDNPNQLGYFAVLSTSILLLLSRMEGMGFRLPFRVVVYACGGFLAAASLSKAAMGAMAILLIVDSLRGSIAPLLAGAAAPILFSVWGGFDLMTRVTMRVSSLQADDALATRGYDRIVNHPGLLVFGAGEGSYGRFLSALPAEMHSSLGTLLFAYGIVGTLLFALGLYATFRLSGWTLGLYLAPAFAYGLTHQGLRFSLLWVLIAVLGASAFLRRQNRLAAIKPIARPAAPPIPFPREASRTW